MPITGIHQPEILPVDAEIRLKRFDGECRFALEWYQEPELVWLVDGVKEPYSPEKLEGMYRYLDAHGELYWIEVLEGKDWIPVGDVTFSADDLPIVIGSPRHRSKGIGQRVIAALVERGKQLGYERMAVREIYDWNPASKHCFERAGFQAVQKTEKGMGYVRRL